MNIQYIPYLRSTDARTYFQQYGGTALGLTLALELAQEISTLQTPMFAVLKTQDVLADRTDYIRTAVEPLVGRQVALRLSGAAEAFSSEVQRGANSSSQHSTLVVSPFLEKATILNALPHKDLAQYQAVVLQEWIPNTQSSDLIIVHADGEQVILETSLHNQRFLFLSRQPGQINHTESTLYDRSVTTIESQIDPQQLIDLHWDLQHRVQFPLNTEGVFRASHFILFQLRPIPLDAPSDVRLCQIIDTLDTSIYSDTTLTYFVYGAFDAEGIIVAHDAIDTQNSMPIIVIDDPQNLPWETLAIRTRLLNHLPTVVLNTTNGFHLAHDPSHLPPLGPLRKHFFCMGVPWLHRNQFIGRQVRVISDGQRGLFLVKDGNLRD